MCDARTMMMMMMIMRIVELARTRATVSSPPRCALRTSDGAMRVMRVQSADEATRVAKAAGDRRVVNGNRKYPSAAAAREAKIAAAKAKREEKQKQQQANNKSTP